MSSPKVIDLSLLINAIPQSKEWLYMTTLCEGLPYESAQPLYKRVLDQPFYKIATEVLKETSDVRCGESLFNWAFPLDSPLRKIFLDRCEEVRKAGNILRLWICLGSSLTNLWEFQVLERCAEATWEGLWVREWADKVPHYGGVHNPFIALNPSIYIMRCPPGVKVPRRFTVPGKINVLIVVSNPSPLSSGRYKHIKHMEKWEKGPGMLLRVYRPFVQHRGTGWVSVLRNPTKVNLATVIREHRPHVLIYLGHGYVKPEGSGIVLVDDGLKEDFEEVSGMRKVPDIESELEQVLSGKAEALSHPGSHDGGLPTKERPRLFISLSCVVAFAAPAILRAGIPAVLAMRLDIPDSDITEAMFERCADVITNKSYSIEEAVADLRQFLKAEEHQFNDKRLHFSVPAVYLAPTGEGADSIRGV